MSCFTVWFGGESAPKVCQASLLEHFSELSDNRAPDWVMDRRLDDVSPEVPLVATRATIFSCDGIDEVAAWSQRHPGVLQRFSAFHFGVSSERWPRTPVNRVDPVHFDCCFESRIVVPRPGRHDLIAIGRAAPPRQS
jgi:hypothetical protein